MKVLVLVVGWFWRYFLCCWIIGIMSEMVLFVIVFMFWFVDLVRGKSNVFVIIELLMISWKIDFVFISWWKYLLSFMIFVCWWFEFIVFISVNFFLKLIFMIMFIVLVFNWFRGEINFVFVWVCFLSLVSSFCILLLWMGL